jgi:hypothetical protein
LQAALLAALLGSVPCSLSATPQTATPSDKNLAAKVESLESELSRTKQDLSRSHDEIEELRRELQSIKAHLPRQAPPTEDNAGTYPTLANVQAAPNPQASPEQEQQDELAARVAEQAQTKVESASRYRVRLSGLILMNTYSNVGRVDVSDLPNLAFTRLPAQPRGDFGGTLRQTQLGLEITGPHLAGAATSADLQADFFGGFPSSNFGVASGLFRLRTARMRMDWSKTSLVGGQDGLFFSPLSPTSYATVAEPALSWAGNLWVWTPQLRAEHRVTVSENSNLLLQGGILDALTEQIPPMQFNRIPTPGEASRKPGIAARAAWVGKWFGREASLGAGGFYARHDYLYSRAVDSWAATTDWTMPLGSYVTVTGEFFRGRALGGLGGGIWNSVVYDGSPTIPTNRVIGLDDIGGWTQLKLQPKSNWEFNIAAGTDNPLAADLRVFPNPSGSYFPPLSRNQSIFANSIYRPRSNLLLALEYRHLRTYSRLNTKQSADHVNLGIGVSF